MLLWLTACEVQRGDPPDPWQVRFDAGPNGTTSGPQRFEVPEGVDSFNLVCGDDDETHAYSLLSLAGPMGDIDGFSVFIPDNPHYLLGEPGALMVEQFPQSPAQDIVPGTYTFRVQVEPADDETECSLVWGSRDATRLDLSLFIGAGTGLDAESAQEDSEVVYAIESTAEIYAAFGLEVGEVTFLDVPEGGYEEPLETADGPDEKARLCRSLDSDPGSIAVVLVSGIQAENDHHPESAAVSGTSQTPGAVGRAGTSQSCLAIALRESDPAHALAHELGHFLGLSHPVEWNGDGFDPLDGTPQCSPGADHDGDGQLSSEECSQENLMWWINDEASRALTDDQAWVIQASGALR